MLTLPPALLEVARSTTLHERALIGTGLQIMLPANRVATALGMMRLSDIAYNHRARGAHSDLTPEQTFGMRVGRIGQKLDSAFPGRFRDQLFPLAWRSALTPIHVFLLGNTDLRTIDMGPTLRHAATVVVGRGQQTTSELEETWRGVRDILHLLDTISNPEYDPSVLLH